MSQTHRLAPNRREMLRTLLAGAAAGVTGSTIAAAVPAAQMQSPATPEAALQALVDGNRRFAANQLTSIAHDLEVLKNHTADKQQPFAAVLACADSRVPVELIFDRTIGQLFVCRVAGNVIAPEIVASLEYGVAVLGVKAILVLGHTNCGAVKAAMKADAVPGQISALYAALRRGVEQSGGDVAKAIQANAAVHADLLRTSSTVIRDAVTAKQVAVTSGVYDLATGKVAFAS